MSECVIGLVDGVCYYFFGAYSKTSYPPRPTLTASDQVDVWRSHSVPKMQWPLRSHSAALSQCRVPQPRVRQDSQPRFAITPQLQEAVPKTSNIEKNQSPPWSKHWVPRQGWSTPALSQCYLWILLLCGESQVKWQYLMHCSVVDSKWQSMVILSNNFQHCVLVGQHENEHLESEGAALSQRQTEIPGAHPGTLTVHYFDYAMALSQCNTRGSC